MCYVGGPRCSNSASKRYQQAKQRYKDNPTPDNLAFRQHAYQEFILTPKGIKQLERWKETAEKEGNDEQTDAIHKLLTQAVNKRDSLLENNKRRSALKASIWEKFKKYPELEETFKVLSKEGKFAYHTPSFYEVREFAHSMGYKKRMPKLSAQDYYAFTNLKLRMEQQRLVNSIKTVSMSEPGSESHLYPLDEEGKIAEVYYASYGSNLNRQRLMNYIEGGRPKGGSRSYQGCEDKSPPQDDIPLKVPHPLHFAMNSSVWKGGVGFVDSSTSAHKSLGRAYLITSDQFKDIVSQESNSSFSEPRVNIEQTIQSGKRESSSKAYGTLVHIGDYNGRPVLTFTNRHSIQDSLSESKSFYSAKSKKSVVFRPNRPSPAYLRMISSGLSETFGMTRRDQVTYFRGAVGCDSMGIKTIQDAIDPPIKQTYKPAAPKLPIPTTTTSNSSYKEYDDDIDTLTYDEWLERLEKEMQDSQKNK